MTSKEKEDFRKKILERREDNIKKIKELYKDGKSISDIAKEVGVSESNVKFILSDMKIGRRRL